MAWFLGEGQIAILDLEVISRSTNVCIWAMVVSEERAGAMIPAVALKEEFKSEAGVK